MQDLFNCAMDIGEQMLICGAEVHRVEDSVERMCSAMGADRTDVFIITSCMIVTIHALDRVYTQTRRITGIGTNIEKLHMLNELSRKICASKMSVQAIREDFENIQHCKEYSFAFECIAYIIISGSFTLFFGGGIFEALISMLIGGILRFLVSLTDKAEINRIFSKFLCSLVVCFVSFGALKIGLINGIDKVIIGNIMLLIPGVGLTNALRDLLSGDSIAGLLRMIEATLSALAIASGYIIFVLVVGGGSI